MADNLKYFWDDDEFDWLANIDSSISDKPSEETQLHKSEISSFIEVSWISRAITVPLRILLSRIPRK